MRISIAIIGLTASAIIHAQSDIVLYGGILDYSDSIKEHAWFSGAYFQQSWTADRLELSYERLEIAYKDANASGLIQNDITAVWTHYLSDEYLTRFGVHYVDSSDQPSDGGFSLFTGMKYFEGHSFDLGVDAYYSYYSEFTSDDLSSNGLQVIQIKPSVGLSYGDYYSAIGSFYTSVYYDYIRPDDDGYSSLEKDYHSIGVLLKNFNGRWTTTIGGWIGKQVFAMQKDGFVMYNLAEAHRSGAEVSLHHMFSDQTGIKVQYGYDSFKEFDFGYASSSAVSGFLNYRF